MCYLHIKAGVSSICCHNLGGGGTLPYIRPSIQAGRRSWAIIEFLLVLKNWLHPTCYSPFCEVLSWLALEADTTCCPAIFTSIFPGVAGTKLSVGKRHTHRHTQRKNYFCSQSYRSRFLRTCVLMNRQILCELDDSSLQPENPLTMKNLLLSSVSHCLVFCS